MLAGGIPAASPIPSKGPDYSENFPGLANSLYLQITFWDRLYYESGVHVRARFSYYAGAAASSVAVVWKLTATSSMRGLFL